jgi:glucose/mannose-6-phosphate isomerase
MERFRLVNDLMQEVVADILEVEAEGEGELAQLLDLVLVGDFVSIHMALQEGIDPGPTPALDDIKAALRGEPEGEHAT